MTKLKCKKCNFKYCINDNEEYKNLTETWMCPICGLSQEVQEENNKSLQRNNNEEKILPKLEFSNIEISIICSNLAKGCIKLHKYNEAESLFSLAEKFAVIMDYPEDVSVDKLLTKIEKDVLLTYPLLERKLKKEKYDVERGILRVLKWGWKVSLIQTLLINEYQIADEEMIRDTPIYVCKVCGCIYARYNLQDRCNVCNAKKESFSEVGE